MVNFKSDTAGIFSSESFVTANRTHLKSGCEDPSGIARHATLAEDGVNYCAVLAKATGGSGRITIKNGRCEQESCSHHERF